jgi:hypothetical protein
MGANIFAAGNQLVSVSASGSDPDPADTSLRFSFGKSGAGSWLFGSMLYGLFPIPPAGSSSYNFTTPMVGRTAVETYLGAVTDNRGGGASGKQFVTVSPVATTLGAPDGTFSVCDSGTANCASSGGIINVLRNDNCGTVPSPIPCAIVAVNYNPVDPDGIAGSVLWDSWYSTYGSSGGTCCYSGTFMNRGLTGSAASAFRISVNSVDRYLETSPTTTAGRKTAIVRVDGATTTPPLAQLSADVVSGPAPLTVNFSMAGTQAFDGKTIQWYFMGCGEGFLYGKTTPTHVCNFANPGTYWIQNSTSDSGGLNDVVNMYIVVTPPGGGGGDTTAPSVNITAPAAGNVKGSINLVASATDNVGGTGMNNVKFYLDSIANPMLGQVNGAGPGFTLNNWNSAGASNGTHTLLAVATDNSGNAATSAGVSILIDNAGPTVNITAPTAGSTVSGTVAINATANDNGGSGVAGVDFRVDGVSIGTDTTAPYTVNWNSTGSSNAGHIITAVATDVLGNSTTSASVNVTVNNITPAPAFGTPGLSFSDAVVKKANVTITANVTGGVAPVTVTFYINDVAVGTPDSAVPYTYNWKVPNAPNRTYTIRAVATDSLGRSTNSPLPNPSFNP